MSTELLQASLQQARVSRTVEHDLESLCWVIIYALYTHALEDMEAKKDDGMRRALSQESYLIFSAASTEKLLRLRRDAFSTASPSFASVKQLKDYARPIHGYLSGLVDISWEFLRNLQPSEDTRGDAEAVSEQYWGRMDKMFPNRPRTVVHAARSDPQTTAEQMTAYYDFFLEFLGDFVFELSHQNGPKK